MERVSLNGEWQADLGGGFIDAPVPGCWDTLTASKTIAGPVTMRRRFTCPMVSEGRRLLLSFDAVSYQCEVFVNEKFVGSHEGMWDRFWFDVTDHLHPGKRNEIRLVVTKPGYAPTDRYPLRDVLSGFIPDVLCTFGGIWGDVELTEVADFLPDLVTVRTDLAAGRAEIGIRVVCLGPNGGPARSAELALRISSEGRQIFATHKALNLRPGTTMVTEHLPLDGVKLWNPEHPALHELEAVIRSAAGEVALHRRIGFREVRAEGERFLLNGDPIYLRGALHWGYYPDRIIPRPTRDEIRQELAGLRAMGFNAVKHCLWVPREEYLELCDELGFLAWLELPLWLPHVTPELESRLQREYPRIVECSAQHPCIFAYSLGCELGKDVGAPILGSLARRVRAISGGALVGDNSGSGECYGGLAEDFSDFSDYHFYADDQNLEPLIESFTPRWRPPRPWFFGEYADADTWRVVGPGGDTPWWSRGDEDANPLSALKPDFHLPMQHQRLADPGLRGRVGLMDPSGELATASREHALLHRKLSIESTRAFPRVGGYNVTVLRDTPIATSGLFDDAMTAKFLPRDLLPFNSDLVLVPRWDPARAWINGDRVRYPDRYNQCRGDDCSLRIIASNYGVTIPDGTWSWRIVDAAGGILAEAAGALDRPLPRGETRELFRICTPLPERALSLRSLPQRVTVHAILEHAADRTENSWPVFVWPRSPGVFPAGNVALHDPLGIFDPLRERYGAAELAALAGRRTDVLVAATVFDERLQAHVRAGGRALVVQRGSGAFPHARVAFWREGFALFEDHPLAHVFPTGSFRELALYGMATDTALSWIEPRGDVRDVRPIITRIDARESIAQHYAVELDYGGGTLIVTTLRLEGGMGTQPAGLGANSAALHLVDSMLCHLQKGIHGQPECVHRRS